MNVLIAIEVAILMAVIGYGYVMISSTLKRIRNIRREYDLIIAIDARLPEAMEKMKRAILRLNRAFHDSGVSIEEFRPLWEALNQKLDPVSKSRVRREIIK